MVGRIEKELTPLTIAEVKEILEKRSAEAEFGYEQQKTLEYVNKIQKLNKEKSRELVKRLMEIANLDIQTSIKIADTLPMFKPTLEVILSKDKIELDDEKKEQILAEIKKFLDQAMYSSSQTTKKEKEEIEKEENKIAQESEKEKKQPTAASSKKEKDKESKNKK